MARMAVIHEPHEYVADPKYKCNHLDHPDHDPSLKASEADHHSPCKVCGAAADAYVHSEEALTGAGQGYTLVQIVSEDSATGSESHAAGSI